jgi:nucleoside-triphosphatase
MTDTDVKIWLITGEPGIGKTSVLMKTVDLIKAHGYRVGGVFSRELKEKGNRIGFEMIDVATGLKKILASSNLNVGPKIGRYRINLKNLAELGAEGLVAAVEVADIIICDEIGPMELFSPEFRRAVKATVASGKPVIGIIHKRLKDPIIEEVKSSPNVEIIEVTRENRDILPGRLAEKVLKTVEKS